MASLRSQAVMVLLEEGQKENQERRDGQEKRDGQCGRESQERREAGHKKGNTVYQGTYSRKGSSPSLSRNQEFVSGANRTPFVKSLI